MIFRVDRNTGLTDYLNGKNYISIACDCWFTASGEIHPRFFKVQEDGDCLYNLTVLKTLLLLNFPLEKIKMLHKFF